jgi:nitronate monooxygenase
MLRTAATTVLGIDRPIIQAGMSSIYTNADLVVAVSEAGGLGVLGCLNRGADEAVAEIRRIRARTAKPFGLNFVVEHLDERAFAACLEERVPILTFFRGDPVRVIDRAKAAGALTLYQVTTAAEAESAVGAGVDVLIAQGSEAGGHVGPVPRAQILPAVRAVAAGRPVLAAGGIVDAQTLAKVLAEGADGAWMGTRFLATPESPAQPAHKRAIIAAGPGSTVRSGVWDAIWGRPWPGVEVRAIRNDLLDRWLGREGEIEASRVAINEAIDQAYERDDAAEMDLLAGAGVDRINTIEPAGELTRSIAAEAESILDGATAG